eukprot:16052266-Heterocapsa_arctica.AAC.1
MGWRQAPVVPCTSLPQPPRLMQQTMTSCVSGRQIERTTRQEGHVVLQSPEHSSAGPWGRWDVEDLDQGGILTLDVEGSREGPIPMCVLALSSCSWKGLLRVVVAEHNLAIQVVGAQAQLLFRPLSTIFVVHKAPTLVEAQVAKRFDDHPLAGPAMPQ